VRHAALIAAGFLFFCLTTPWAHGQETLSFQSSELRLEGDVKDVVIADMNGDKLCDIVLLYHPAEKKVNESSEPPKDNAPGGGNNGLSAAVFLQDGAVGFTQARTGWILALPQETIAYSIGNYGPEPGDEIVVIDKLGAQVLRATAGPTEQMARRILDAAVFFSKPDTTDPFSWFWPEDLDCDGRNDLVLPTGQGYCVCLQEADGDFGKRRYELAVPVTARLAGSAAGELSFARTMPLPCVGDFDGDAKNDLIFLAEQNLLVFLQGSEGGFPARPSLELPGNFHRSREYLGRIVNVALWASDVNADGRIDVVAFVSEGAVAELENVRSSVLLFLGRGREGFRETPDAIVNMQSMLVSQWVGDFNGDRRTDLMVASVKTDLVHSIVKHVAREALVEYAIYLCDPASGLFVAEPSYLGQERVPAEGGISGKLAQFHVDLDGDGITDRVGIREKEGKRFIQVRRGKIGAKPRSMAFEKKPMIEQEIDRQGWLRLADVNGDGRCDVLLVKQSSVQVLVARR
jgi:hypothetical protein